MQDNKVSLGKFIARRRKYLRMTQEQLAQRLIVSKSAVAKWETDRGIPDRDNIAELAKCLEVPIKDLYRLVDDKSAKVDLEMNITSEVISLLESYGYVVIAPNQKEEME